jgi:hypothetical protein
VSLDILLYVRDSMALRRRAAVTLAGQVRVRLTDLCQMQSNKWTIPPVLPVLVATGSRRLANLRKPRRSVPGPPLTDIILFQAENMTQREERP